jgi:hypothetical protein
MLLYLLILSSRGVRFRGKGGICENRINKRKRFVFRELQENIIVDTEPQILSEETDRVESLARKIDARSVRMPLAKPPAHKLMAFRDSTWHHNVPFTPGSINQRARTIEHSGVWKLFSCIKNCGKRARFEPLIAVQP